MTRTPASKQRATAWLRSRGAAWLVAFIACSSTSQLDLFTSNQQTYLVRAVALSRAPRILAPDWFVRTADPVPGFTVLAEPLVALGEWATRLANALLGAVLLVSLAELARGPESASPRAPARTVAWVALFALLWVALPTSLRSLVFDGVADQRAYSDYLQPSNAGVLLVLAVSLALQEQSLAAVLASAAAAWLHPTYLLSAGLLVFGVCLLDVRAGRAPSRTSRVALLGFLALAPPTLWALRVFLPNPELANRASEVLVSERMPYHALLGAWLGPGAMLRVAVIVLAIALTRGRTRALLALCASATLAATALVAVLGRPDLRLLFPWRTSVWLVPSSTALLFGWLSAAFSRERAPWLRLCLVPLLAACGYRFLRPNSRAAAEDYLGVALARTVPVRERERWALLVPVTWESVRLNAPADIYVDFKSHPYKDNEVLEWWRRVQLARAVFPSNGELGCESLATVLDQEPRLGFVLAPASFQRSACPMLSFVTRDRDGTLYGVRGRTSAE
ncbi:MAG TPA: DUF6798 domain-containing protein [Polyangiaceae bacterium]|jgi:hypothetical protein|nr:DUF6798 domain-containing protein [Polyangiaceae bacterium]